MTTDTYQTVQGIIAELEAAMRWSAEPQAWAVQTTATITASLPDHKATLVRIALDKLAEQGKIYKISLPTAAVHYLMPPWINPQGRPAPLTVDRSALLNTLRGKYDWTVPMSERTAKTAAQIAQETGIDTNPKTLGRSVNRLVAEGLIGRVMINGKPKYLVPTLKGASNENC
jgi:hypothetical protein